MEGGGGGVRDGCVYCAQPFNTVNNNVLTANNNDAPAASTSVNSELYNRASLS